MISVLLSAYFVYVDDKKDFLRSSSSVTETLSFEDLVLTFLRELREFKKAAGVSCEFVARSISSLLEVTNMEQKIEADRLLNLMLKVPVSTCDKIFLHLCTAKSF